MFVQLSMSSIANLIHSYLISRVFIIVFPCKQFEKSEWFGIGPIPYDSCARHNIEVINIEIVLVDVQIEQKERT